jgi:hypothetical protein
MSSILLIQYRSSLAIIEELQQHADNGEKHDLYEQHKQQLKQRIAELTGTTGSQLSASTQGIHPYPLRGPSGGASLRQLRAVSLGVL